MERTSKNTRLLVLLSMMGIAGVIAIVAQVAVDQISPWLAQRPWVIWGSLVALIPVFVILYLLSKKHELSDSPQTPPLPQGITEVKLPTGQLPIDPLDDPEDAALFVPATRDMIAAAIRASDEAYDEDAASAELTKAWHEKNPFSYAVYWGSRTGYLGHLDMLAIRDDIAEKLRSGMITEEEIPADGVVPYERLRHEGRLYVAGITVKDPRTPIGEIRFAAMIGAVPEYIEKLWGSGPHIVYVIAATEDGRRLIHSLGGIKVAEGTTRKDRHDFYEIPVTNETLQHLRKRASKRAPAAELRWTMPLPGTPEAKP